MVPIKIGGKIRLCKVMAVDNTTGYVAIMDIHTKNSYKVLNVILDAGIMKMSKFFKRLLEIETDEKSIRPN